MADDVKRLQYGSTTTELATRAGVAKQLVVDTTKNTAVVMDGTTLGGHPLAKESLLIKAGTPNVKINGGDMADHSATITISVLPGTTPTGIEVVENPEGQEPGKYLDISYLGADGQPAHYYVDFGLVNNVYKGSDTIAIAPDGTISVKLGNLFDEDSPFTVDENGKLGLDLTKIIADDGILSVKDGKLTVASVVSKDDDNILSEGTDKLAYMPGDLGPLGDD